MSKDKQHVMKFGQFITENKVNEQENKHTAGFNIEATGGESKKTGTKLPGPYTHKVTMIPATGKDETGNLVKSRVKSFVTIDGNNVLLINSNSGDINISAGDEDTWANADKYIKYGILGMLIDKLHLNAARDLKNFANLGLGREFQWRGVGPYAVSIYNGQESLDGAIKVTKIT